MGGGGERRNGFNNGQSASPEKQNREDVPRDHTHPDTRPHQRGTLYPVPAQYSPSQPHSSVHNTHWSTFKPGQFQNTNTRPQNKAIEIKSQHSSTLKTPSQTPQNPTQKHANHNQNSQKKTPQKPPNKSKNHSRLSQPHTLLPNENSLDASLRRAIRDHRKSNSFLFAY